jgi:hypothetical protein
VNVVVLIDKAPLGVTPTPNEYRIRMLTFQDRANDETNPLPADEQAAVGNFQQDTGFLAGATFDEPTLGEVVLPTSVVLWKQGGTKHDAATAIAFDEYNGDATLTDRVAFLPTGGIAPPEDTATSGLPNSGGGRGIYFADSAGKNFFRLTVDSDVTGRLRVEKYQAGSGYQVSGWTWY